jgi:GalNAc-alpha-(1->4)-GalNAc-alpha-(1->3)-diNAcBac-PP-undecaprenol alpha-1,4-N-acetyl-D-galactosaminyltransferase
MESKMSEEKKKICLIAPSLQMGGIERAMSTLANYFVTQGHEIHFLTLFPFEPFFELDKRIILYNPPFAFPRYGRNQFQTLNYYFKMLAPFYGYLRKLLIKIQPDVIMCFGDWYPHAIMLQTADLKIPFYYCNRSNPNIKYNPFPALIRFLAYKFSPPTGIIAQTHEAMLRKQKLLGKRIPIKIIPNPVRRIEKIDIQKENWIVSVGRLHLEKGFVRLMESFSMLDNKGWKLVLAGGGKHEIEIKQKSIDLGIAENVIFLGKVTNIDELLLKSKIFVLSSHKEGYPNALCEAMSAGLACISFDIVAGPKDIIVDGENGFLVPDNDIKGMADKIQQLIDDDNLQKTLGKKASQIVATNSIESIGNTFLNFILNNNGK